MSVRIVALLVGLACFGAAAAGIGVRATYGAQLSGDEPHYLLTAISVAEDGSLDVGDEYRERRYLAFHEGSLSPQERVQTDGRMVTPHDPLLPALLAGPYAAGGWIAAKLCLALVSGLLGGLLVWVAVRRLGVPMRAAAAVVLVFGLSAPFAVYGTQVYPELAAALCVAAAAAALLGPLGPPGFAVVGAAAVALPWLSVKYVPVAAVLVLLALVRARRRQAVALAGALALAGLAYLVAHQAWYGGWTVYAAGDHFVGGELTVVGHDPSYVGRARRLLGLLVDRTFGLAAWQPAWLLLAPALGVVAARRPRGWPVLALPLAAGWIVATFVALTMHGWWWPGRQLVVVLPLAVLLIALWAGGSGRRLAVAVAAGAVGIATHAWVVAEGLTRNLTWVVDFYETSSPWYAVWRHALPDWPRETGTTWLLAAGWVLVLGSAAAYEYTVTRRACGRTVTREPSGTTSFDGRWETSVVPSPSRTR
jgi:hypothetical protein